jgi:hypothetical protein
MRLTHKWVTFRNLADGLQKILEGCLGTPAALVISTYQGDTDSLEVMCVSANAPDDLGVHPGIRIDVGERLTGWVAATNRRIVNSDAALDARRPDAGRCGAFAYCSAFPVHRVGGNLSGVLTVFTCQTLSESLISYLDLVLPRLASELERLALPDLECSWIPIPVREERDRAEIVRLVEAAFGKPPATLKLRAKDRDTRALAHELLVATGSPIGLADILFATDREELVIVSPRRDEFRVAIAAWARSRDTHHVLGVHLAETGDKRVSA